MTSFTRGRSRSRDLQDSVERGVWGKREDVPGAGSILSVRGTGTTDIELPIVNFGYSFHLAQDANAEVIMLSLGADVEDKVALPILPRDLQHQWPEGTGGIQHPTNPDRRIEFNGDEIFLRDGKFVVGSNREVTIEVDGSNVKITTGGGATIDAQSLDLNVSGAVNINSAQLMHNGKDIGDTHTHSGVLSGSANTGVPN